jgi:hypothetical protein
MLKIQLEGYAAYALALTQCGSVVRDLEHGAAKRLEELSDFHLWEVVTIEPDDDLTAMCFGIEIGQLPVKGCIHGTVEPFLQPPKIYLNLGFGPRTFLNENHYPSSLSFSLGDEVDCYRVHVA